MILSTMNTRRRVICSTALLLALASCALALRALPGSSSSRALLEHPLQLEQSSLLKLDCTAENKEAMKACVAFQTSMLRAAIREGAAKASSWKTWAADRPSLQEPDYGAWRFVDKLAASKEEQHANWIVITSIAPPTEQIKAWAALSDWKVVVVGDDKSPSDWHVPGVIFLSVEQQLQLPFRFARVVPHRNYARKAIGYLYAMQHGAKLVYESDDDNAPKPGLGLSWIAAENSPSAAVTRGNGIAVNPYAYFGKCTIWPRGYPLSKLLQHGANYCYSAEHAITAAAPSSPEMPSAAGSAATALLQPKIRVPIQQGLADLDPDVVGAPG